MRVTTEKLNNLIFNPIDSATNKKWKVLNCSASALIFIFTLGIMPYFVHRKFKAKQLENQTVSSKVSSGSFQKFTKPRPKRKEIEENPPAKDSSSSKSLLKHSSSPAQSSSEKEEIPPAKDSSSSEPLLKRSSSSSTQSRSEEEEIPAAKDSSSSEPLLKRSSSSSTQSSSEEEAIPDSILPPSSKTVPPYTLSEIDVAVWGNVKAILTALGISNPDDIANEWLENSRAMLDNYNKGNSENDFQLWKWTREGRVTRLEFDEDCEKAVLMLAAADGNPEAIYHYLEVLKKGQPDIDLGNDPESQPLLELLKDNQSGPGKFYRAVIGYGLTVSDREILMREALQLGCEEALHDYYAPSEYQLFPDKKQDPMPIQNGKLYNSANLGHSRALFERGSGLLPEERGVIDIAKAASQGHREAINAMIVLCPDSQDKAAWIKLKACLYEPTPQKIATDEKEVVQDPVENKGEMIPVAERLEALLKAAEKMKLQEAADKEAQSQKLKDQEAILQKTVEDEAALQKAALLEAKKKQSAERAAAFEKAMERQKLQATKVE